MRSIILKGNIAFTLIELLVVVAVVAILSALLFPALKTARARGQAATCGSNLRQTYIAFGNFAADNNGVVPSNKQYGAPGWGYYWQFLGEAYLGKGETYPTGANGVRYPVLKCPSEVGSFLTIGQPQTGPPVKMYDNPWMPSSYAENTIVNYGAWNLPARTRFAQNTMHGEYSSTYQDGRVLNVSEESFLIDAPVWSNWGWGNPEFSYGIDFPFSVFPTQQYAFRHLGQRVNVMWFDGHLEANQHFSLTGKRLWTWKFP